MLYNKNYRWKESTVFFINAVDPLPLKNGRFNLKIVYLFNFESGVKDGQSSKSGVFLRSTCQNCWW